MKRICVYCGASSGEEHAILHHYLATLAAAITPGNLSARQPEPVEPFAKWPESPGLNSR